MIKIQRNHIAQYLEDRDFQSLVRYLIQSSENILDIGCGIGDYLKYTNSSQHVVAIEPHLPYLEKAKENYGWAEYHNQDGIEYLAGSTEKFDLVLLIDVVEHLPEEEAVKLVNLAIEHSDGIIISQIPYGIHEQHDDHWNLGGEYWQTHRSTWDEKNLEKLPFSFTKVWRNFYDWDSSVNKTNDTIIALWDNLYKFNSKEYSESSLKESDMEFLRQENFDAWQKAFAEGYNSNMGDHRNYFYDSYIKSMGLYNDVQRAKKVAEFGPGNGEFMLKFIAGYPMKQFYLIDIAEMNIGILKNKFNSFPNVSCILNKEKDIPVTEIDLGFSFLLCQSVPKLLWAEHLSAVKKALSENGTYFFQFAYHPKGISNNSVTNAISGSNKYKPEEIFGMLENAGFSGCDITEPISLEAFKTDIIWYFVRAY